MAKKFVFITLNVSRVRLDSFTRFEMLSVNKYKTADIKNKSSLSFTSLREDRETLLLLTKESGAIPKARELRLKAILNKFSQDGSSNNIRFLFDIIKNNKYRIASDSALRDFSEIKSGSKFANNEWNGLLAKAVKNAIALNNTPEKEQLAKELELINTEKAPDNIKVALFKPEEELLLQHRGKILSSLDNLSALADKKEILNQKASIKTNIDYFIRSSECTMAEKAECLKLLVYFVSPEYKINPQLKDKKFQVLSEIMNDIVVKTPDQEVLTIKKVNQRQHGMCAAISLARKMLPHEFKTQFVSNVLAELDEKPTMEVFDVTSPEPKKIQAQKSIIDYNTADNLGYRIIDASSLNWMHIADSLGNGEMQAGVFVAYDKEHYGMFHDSHLTLDMPDDLKAKQMLLRADIKLNEITKKIKNNAKSYAEADEKSINAQKNSAECLRDNINFVTKILLELIPEDKRKDAKNLKVLAELLLQPKRVKNKNFDAISKELKIIPQEDKIVKKHKLSEIITLNLPDVDKNQLEKAVDKIYNLHLNIQENEKEADDAKKFQTPKAKVNYYKNLFKAAAFYRVKKEFELDIPERLSVHAFELGVKTKNQLAVDKLNTLIADIKDDNNDLKTKFKEFKAEIEDRIPVQMDSIINKLGYTNKNELLKEFLSSIADNIEINNDKEELVRVANSLKIKPEKKAVVAELKKLSSELTEKNADKNKLFDTARAFGLEDDADFAKIALTATFMKLQNGISKEETEKISDGLGVGNDTNAIPKALKSLENEIKTVKSKYAEISTDINADSQKDIILKMLEKKGEIYSRKVLDNLQEKFAEIVKFADKEVQVKIEDYQKDIFKKIESDLSKIIRENIREYKNINKELEKPLSQIYQAYGESKGYFWNGEEGHSGLRVREQLRIYKQMTGINAHSENNPDKAFELIEKGIGGANLSSHVSEKTPSAHAQYVYAIGDKNIPNPDSGEVKAQKVLFLDNTWGDIEKVATWKDSSGNTKTDYGNGYGNKGGFVTTPEGLEGFTQDGLATTKGTGKIHNHSISYPMFMDMILKGGFSDIDKDCDSLLAGFSKEKIFLQQLSIVINNIKHGNFEEIKKLQDELTVKTVKIAMNSIEKHDLNIDKSLAKEVDTLLSGYNGKIFKSQGKALISRSISSEVKKAFDSITKSQNPETLQKVLLTREFEKIISKTLKENTLQGEKRNFNKIKALQNETKSLNNRITKLINGELADELCQYKINGGLKTVEDFQKLPENHILRIIIRKMLMMKYISGSFDIFQDVSSSKTQKELDNVQNEIVDKRKKDLIKYFNKDEMSLKVSLSHYQNILFAAVTKTEKEAKVNLSELKDCIKKEFVTINTSGGFLKTVMNTVDNITKTSIDEISSKNNISPEARAILNAKLKTARKEFLTESFHANSFEKLNSTEFGQDIIGLIDAKYKPQSNKELMTIFKKLHLMEPAQFNELLDSSVHQELGIKYEDEKRIFERLKAGSNYDKDNLGKTINIHVAGSSFGIEKLSEEEKLKMKEAEDFDNWLKTPEAKNLNKKEKEQKINEKLVETLKSEFLQESVLRKAYSCLSCTGLDKIVNNQKQTAFEQYKLRPSFPQIKTISDKEKSEIITENLNILAGIASEISDLKKNKNTDISNKEIEKEMNRLQSSLKLNTDVFVRGFIRPKEYNKANELLKELYSSLNVDPKSERTQKSFMAVAKLFDENFIIDYPMEFWEEFLNKVPEISEKSPKLVETWESHLARILKASNNSLLEFEIADNILKGKLPEISQRLKNPDYKALVDPETNETISLNSEKGMAFIFKALQDPINDNHTLIHFLKQTGMIEDAVKFFMAPPAPSKHLTLIKRNVVILDKHVQQQQIINQTFDNYKASLKATNPPASLDNAIEGLFKALDSTFKEKQIKDDSVLLEYKKQIIESLEISKELQKPQEVELLTKWHNEISERQEAYTEENIETILLHTKIISKKASAISLLETMLPENSSMKTAITAYKKEVEETLKKMEEIKNTLQNPILDKIEAKRKEELAKASLKQPNASVLSAKELEDIAHKDAQDKIDNLSENIIQGDKNKIQFLVKQIVDSKSKILDGILEKTLFDNSKPQLLRTFASGILLKKGKIDTLINYGEKALENNGKLAEHADDQALIIVADALIEGISSSDKEFAQKSIKLLEKFFKASCDKDNDVPIANQLMQSFMNTLANNNAADNMLFGIFNDKKADINSRSVAANILIKSNSIAFIPVFEDFIGNPAGFTESSGEQLQLLDVIAGLIITKSKTNNNLDLSKFKEKAKNLNLDAILVQALQQETDITKKDELNLICKRIKEKLAEL